MEKAAQYCMAKIREVDFDRLPISDYNRSYIRDLIPQLDYRFLIYTQTLSLFPQHRPEEKFIVDFGGGHGFLSFFLKRLGYRVIYCDRNPLSVETVTCLKEPFSEGPDYIVQGSTPELIRFCREENLNPDFLIATDLIEHVYDLSAFFQDLKILNPSLEINFTTSSNPLNWYKNRRLHAYMTEDEKTFLTQRRDFIAENYPELSPRESDQMARLCRGKIYADIRKTVDLYRETGILPEELPDRFNTCDPSNGNWTERILPFGEYIKLADAAGFKTSFAMGFYNEKRNNKLFAAIFYGLNRFIKRFPRAGRYLAPYILIRLSPSA